MSTSKRRIGVGLISVGWMGQLHTRAYRSVPTVYPKLGIVPDLLVAADSAPDRAEFARELSGTVKDLAARYHDECAPGGREHRLVVALYPSITR